MLTAPFTRGYYALKQEGEKKMATSSIFANIELKDPDRVRAFVDALCSDKPWPQPKTKVEETQRTYDDFCKFLDDSPYALAHA